MFIGGKMETQAKRQNVVFLLTDQQRYDTTAKDIMPNLNSLMDDGTFFENCYTCQPVCGPARSCLQSGVYAEKSGCYKNGISLPRDIKLLAEYFNENDYHTAYIGKWHLATDFNFNCETKPIPEDRLGGYSYFRGADVLEFTSNSEGGYIFDEKGKRIDFEGYRADKTVDFALEYLDNFHSERPFFMMISTLEPHHQNNEGHFRGYKETVEKFKDYEIPDDLKGTKGNGVKEYPDYLSAINRIDYNLGRIVEKLKEKNVFDDTVIVYSSDHSCHFKTRNIEYKRSCHDNSIHIPLVICGGQFSGGKTDSRLVSLIDIPATLLGIARIETPENYDGYDLQNTENTRECVYVQISESQCGRAIRTNKYKYSVSIPSMAIGMSKKNSKVYFEDFLYDLESDPNEKNNLIRNKKYAKVRALLKDMLLTEMEKAEGKRAIILPKIF